MTTVLYPYSELAVEIYPRLVGKDHIFGYRPIAFRRKIGIFVYIYPDTVSQRMGEIFAVSERIENFSRDLIRFASLNPFFDKFRRRVMRREYGEIGFEEFLVRFAVKHRPRHIRTISFI